MHRAPMHRTLALAGASLLTLASCNAVPEFEVTAIAQQMNIDGSIDVEDNEGALGSNPNSVEQLGLDDDPTVFEPRATLRWLGFELSVDYFDVDYSGDGTASLNFSGTPIVGPVESRLDWAQARAIATWDLVPTDMVDVGLGVGVSYIDFEAQFDSVGGSETLEGSAPIPYPALRAAVEFWRVELGGTVGWIAFNADEVDAEFLEADVYGRIKLIDSGVVWGGLVVGYRLIDTDIEYEDDGDFGKLDLELSGPYAGITLAF